MVKGEVVRRVSLLLRKRDGVYCARVFNDEVVKNE